MLYWTIFWCYFKIGLFSIGGGHASIPIVQSMIVERYHWLTMAEFTDMITIAEMTPGPFAINSATFVGIKMSGMLGGVIATLGCMLPSFFIILLLAFLYKKYSTLRAVSGALEGIRPAATALIASAGASILCMALFGTSVLTEIASVDIAALCIAAAAFLIIRIKKANPVLMIIVSGVAGMIVYGMMGGSMK